MPGLSEAASELESIARHLRRAGQQDLVRSLQKAIRDTVRPVQDDVRAGLADHMPRPYAEVLDAELEFRVSVQTGSPDPGVRLIVSSRGPSRRLRRLEAGILPHPLFGDREHWYDLTPANSKMRAGFVASPYKAAVPRVREAIVAALDDVAQRAVQKGP